LFDHPNSCSTIVLSSPVKCQTSFCTAYIWFYRPWLILLYLEISNWETKVSRALSSLD
jgi:hypothetical protein